SRLNRHGFVNVSGFGSQTYSKEELVAEMGASFLSGHAGIEADTIDNSASYIAGWLKRLRDDKRLVVQAAAQAQKAADFIRGIKWEGGAA
ncbi:MAG: antirestriction protein, partial [Planctomycetes bacterium]|nr:antirestriction protein [Planctomycetota bacterium]